MKRVLSLLMVTLLWACGDDGGGTTDIKITSDLPTQIDGQVVTEAGTDGGVDGQVVTEAGTDGPVVTEAGTDGPVVVTEAGTDGPVVVTEAGSDGPVTDAAVTDGPKDGPIVDAPLDGLVDAPAVDAPLPDAPLPDTTVDAPLADFPPVADTLSPDTVSGQNEAGQYLCTNASGVTAPCQCNDGVDNDKDKKIDWPNDPCCVSAWDNVEAGGITECSDCIDNDGDGKADAADPDCTGYLDNSEANLGTSISGDNKNCHQDCFFDGDSGSGNDGCEWDLHCDPLEPSQHIISPPAQTNCLPYDSTMLGTASCPWETTTCTTYCHESQQCLNVCLPITPNGCDCFGCCAIPLAGGGTKTVLLRDTCQANADGTIDPDQDDNNDGKLDCPPCTQQPDCINTCGPCEICIGKPTIDPSCYPPPPSDAGPADAWPYDAAPPSPCDPGVIYCGPGGIDPNMCPPNTYCVTGCCIPNTP